MITKSRRDLPAVIGADDPTVGHVVVLRRDDRGLELDVLAEVEPVGDVPQVAEDLRLVGEPLGPRPLLQQLLGEAGPRTDRSRCRTGRPDSGSRTRYRRRRRRLETHPKGPAPGAGAQVQARYARPDDDRVVVGVLGRDEVSRVVSTSVMSPPRTAERLAA